MQKKLLLLIFGVLMCSNLLAQDPQFSQFYAAPLYLNPAFAGSNNATRAILNYRNQWPSMDANFVTYVASFDHFVRKYNSGVGVMAFFDQEGTGGYKSYTIAAQYAYELRLNEKLTFRPGLQAAFSNRNLNTSDLTFTDELNPDGSQSGFGDELINVGRSYMDISAGGVLYTERLWIGFSAHHLNSPQASFVDEGVNRIPRKFSVHTGYKIPIKTNRFPKTWRSGQREKSGYNDREREVSITPALNFKNQGPFNQLDAGLYFTYEPITFGAWYRGIPIGGFNSNAINQDALIFLLGVQIQDLHIGYSYDYTVSRLGASTGGAHELSLIFDFYLGYRNHKKKNPPKNVRRMPCPNF